MLKVLLVDDEPFIVKGLAVLLDWRALGYEIAATAENGREALKHLEREPFDLILCDVQMPEMNGLDLLDTIRKRNLSDAHFVILSGYNEFEYARRAMRGGSTDYLLKPIQREELTDLLLRIRKERLIAQRARERAAGAVRSEIVVPKPAQKEEHFANLPVLDKLVRAVSENDKGAIRAQAQTLCQKRGGDADRDYLTQRLAELSPCGDDQQQEELRENLRRRLGESDTTDELDTFLSEYADFLAAQRQGGSQLVLANIEREVQRHYADNLTLKSLSQKYYVNSAYLGQVFRKQYGMAFKDYLNNYRIERAAELLANTDERVSRVAQLVGCRDTSYFVERFIERKGCTPTAWRAKMRKNDE